jgi:Domain of unknown function (DUF1854)
VNQPDNNGSSAQPNGIFTSPEKLRVRRNGRGDLEAELDGKTTVNIRVARCFPWTLEGELISLHDKDGKEIALLERLDGLDAASRGEIQQELRDRVFVPKITRITSHKAEFDIISISALTDRGEVQFQIRSRDDVNILSNRRALFRDVDGNMYEIEDIHSLDKASQRHLERYF